MLDLVPLAARSTCYMETGTSRCVVSFSLLFYALAEQLEHHTLRYLSPDSGIRARVRQCRVLSTRLRVRGSRRVLGPSLVVRV